MSIDDLIARLKADKRTTWAAGVVLALLAAGKALSAAMLEPWGTCVSGLGGFLAVGALAFASFSPPTVSLDQDKTPPGGVRLITPPQDQPPNG